MGGQPKTESLASRQRVILPPKQAGYSRSIWSVTGGKAVSNAVQLAVAAFLIAELLAPLGGCILAGKRGGGSQICPGLYQVIQNLNPVLGIPANGEVINEQQL